MRLIIRIYFIIAFLLVSVAVFADELEYGLQFSSYEKNKDSRTGVDFTSEDKLYFGPKSELEFELKLNTDEYPFGHIFRIIGNQNVYLGFSLSDNGDKYTFALGDESEIYFTEELNFRRSDVVGKWMKITISFSRDNIKCNIDDRQVIIDKGASCFRKSSFFLGKNTSELYSTTDVPPITIRNVKILRNNKPKYYWKFDYGVDGVVLDSICGSSAIVNNPHWIMKGHMSWVDDFMLSLNHSNPQIAVDKVTNRVFVAYHHTLLSVDLSIQEVTYYDVLGGNPFIGASSQMIYDSKKNVLISYSLEDKRAVFYDFNTHRWSGESTRDLLFYQHHSRIFDDEKGTLYTFGGYGIHQYSNDFIKWNFSNSNNIDLGDSLIIYKPNVSPSYLTSIADYSKDSLIVLGGYGSVTGKQKDSPVNFYDIHKICKEDGVSKKLGVMQLSRDGVHYAFSNSSVYKDGYIYTLYYDNNQYDTNILLGRVDLNNNLNCSSLRDSISFKFKDIRSYADLFLSSDKEKLYALVLNPTSDSTRLSIHSIDFPPAFIKDKVVRKENKFIYILTALAVLAFISALVLFLFKIKKKKERIGKLETYKEKLKNDKLSISLLGPFRIYNEQSRDITKQLSPIMQDLLSYLILESAKRRGISPASLEAAFWNDMDHKSALNNIRVNMSKLRKILSNMSQTSIEKKEGLWYLTLDPAITCDYIISTEILQVLSASVKYDKSDILELVRINSKGLLGARVNEQWFDNYKSEYSNVLISILYKASEQRHIQSDKKLIVQIADILLANDNLDELAISIKCKALVELGQKSSALRAYNAFCSEYNTMTGTEFLKKFSDII